MRLTAPPDLRRGMPDRDLLHGSRAIAAYLGVPKATAKHLIRAGAIPWFPLAGVACALRSGLAAHFVRLEAAKASVPPPAPEAQGSDPGDLEIDDLVVLYEACEEARDAFRAIIAAHAGRPQAVQAFAQVEADHVQARMDGWLRELTARRPATGEERHVRFAARLRAAVERADWTEALSLQREDEALREAGLEVDPLSPADRT